jgi:hypothetical protein
MPIMVHCDICKRVMGETDLNRLKKFKKVHGERCEECTRIFEHINKFTSEVRKVKLKEMDAIFENLRLTVENEIQRVVENPPPKLGVFKRIKRYLFGDKPKEVIDEQERDRSLQALP